MKLLKLKILLSKDLFLIYKKVGDKRVISMFRICQKNNNLSSLMISIGVFIVVITAYLSSHSLVTDFLLGNLYGIGIGLEIIGILILYRNRKRSI